MFYPGKGKRKEQVMLAEAMQLLYKWIVQPQVLEVHEDEKQKIKLVVSNGGKADIVAYDLIVDEFEHRFDTLDGLIDFCEKQKGAGTDKKAVIFVEDSEIFADFAHGKPHRKQSAFVALCPTEEYGGLQNLFRGVTQRELWVLLATTLEKAMPAELFLKISALDVKTFSQSGQKIDVAGIQSGDGSYSLQIQCGPESKTIPVEWVWKSDGLWECYRQELVEIKLRLEILASEKAGEMIFKFHPRHLETIRRTERERIATYLKAELDAKGTESQVYLGNNGLE